MRSRTAPCGSAEASIVRAIQLVSTERGRDPARLRPRPLRGAGTASCGASGRGARPRHRSAYRPTRACCPPTACLPPITFATRHGRGGSRSTPRRPAQSGSCSPRCEEVLRAGLRAPRDRTAAHVLRASSTCGSSARPSKSRCRSPAGASTGSRRQASSSTSATPIIACSSSADSGHDRAEIVSFRLGAAAAVRRDPAARPLPAMRRRPRRSTVDRLRPRRGDRMPAAGQASVSARSNRSRARCWSTISRRRSTSRAAGAPRVIGTTT